jgi:ribonuclease G
MTGSIIVINVDIRETRVALVEGGVIAELQIERASHRGTVGNVVLGKVTRVLPGMQAAFIDVGQERSAFLHVEDLIRPDDFDLYLSGGGDEENESFRGTGERKAARQRDEDDEDEDDDEVPPSLNGGVADARRQTPVEPPVSALADASADDDDEDEDDDVVVEREADEVEDADEVDIEDVDEPEDADDGDVEDADDDDDEEDLDEGDEDDDETEAAEGGVSDAPFATGDAPAADDDDDDDDEELVARSGGEAVPPTATTVSQVEVAFGLDSEVSSEGSQPVAERRVRTRPTAEAAVALAQEPRPSGRGSGNAGREKAGRGEAPRADAPRVDSRDRGRSGRSRSESGRSDSGRSDVRADADSKSRSSDNDSGRGRQRRGRGGAQGARGRRGRQRNEGGGGDAKLVRGRRPVRGKNGGARTETSVPPRVTRSVPITEVVKEGDHVVVQISKEPIGTKGARVTSHVSLPGRYVVYLPTVDHLGISKRIGSSRERQRLRQVMESLKPARGGLIVRTVAEGLTKKQLKADVGYLIRVWAEVCKKRETARASEVLYTELDLVLKVARDLFTDEVKSIVIDDREQYNRLVRFVEMFLPERVKDIELYTGSEPIFDAYGIEDEIGRALSRKVPLPSGGSLIVDQAEALTAIDVNTGRYVGKGSKDLEETALKTNLEAVEEIAYQLRFRNIGGLVILDLIDMEKYGNREKVWRALEAALVKDKAKTTLNRISELGLIEMTRKRTRESLGRMLHEPCFYCDGTGQIQSKATIAYEILRQIGRERYSLPGYSVVVNAHPAIVDFLKTVDRAALDEAERRYTRRIELNQRTEYHIEQYDLQGK